MSDYPISTSLRKRRYHERVLDTKPIGYWPLWEPSGAVAANLSFLSPAANGSYSNAALNNPGAGDGLCAPLFNGTTSFVNPFSATLASAFNAAELSIGIWVKMSAAAVWTDATVRYAIRFAVNGTNTVDIYKNSVNNQIVFEYTAGGVGSTIALVTSAPLGWSYFVYTVSKSANLAVAYSNGLTVSSTTVGGTWVGTIANGQCAIGAATTVPSSASSAYLAHAMVWNRPLVADEVLALSMIG